MLRFLVCCICVTIFPSLALFPSLASSQDDHFIGNIEFAKPDGHSLKLDLYLPSKSAAPKPAIVFIHGGGWKNGSKASAKKNAAWLSDHGFVVAGIDYRLTDTAGWPAQIDDCYAAVRWLRNNAAKYNIDPNSIGCMGTSAGAHLAVLMGTRSCPKEELVSSRVQAVCDWFGPTDLMTMPPNNVGKGRSAEDVAKSNGAKLLRATVREVPKLARDASGIDHVSDDDPPFLIMHGDKDRAVPLEQSTRLHATLTRAGVPSTLKLISGAGHGGKQFHEPNNRNEVLRFFEDNLKAQWRQGAGPNADFVARRTNSPTTWSVVRDHNIRWKKTLPETGQSTVSVWGNRLFFSTMKPVEADSQTGSDLVAWCCDADSGDTLWTREIPAKYPLRLSGCFGDSSAPPAVVDDKRVIFFNASGMIVCFDREGNEQWNQEMMPVSRTLPFIIGDSVAFIRQSYMPDDQGHFSHEHKDAPLEKWTQLTALNRATGEISWVSQCGVNMGCIPMFHQLADGRRVIFVGRGGGHSPPEKPDGVSMISADDGSTIWTLPLEGFMSTMTFNLHGDHMLVFHGGEHLWVDTATGKVDRRISFVKDVSVCRHAKDSWSTETETLPGSKKRAIIQSSNILIGNYHYFRSYTKPYLGRVNANSGEVEFLQLPVDVRRTAADKNDQLLWDASGMSTDLVASLLKRGKKRAKTLPITQWAFAPNDMKNSRGFVVMGDARSQGTGWGHHASQIPTVVGKTLFIPILNGTTYAIDWNVVKLDQNAIIAINDLGPDGQSYNRASISYAGGRLYAHTIRELICIENQSGAE